MAAIAYASSRLLVCAKAIRAHFPHSTYDHRPNLPDLDPDHPFTAIARSEQFRVGYACFKREVARVLAPERILEVGLGAGVSALAFMDACPNATYCGIDNDVYTDRGQNHSYKPTQFVTDKMSSLGYQHAILTCDSQAMESFPPADFIHIDGNHGYAETVHDVTLAWNTGAQWILVDDCRDSTVAAATMEVVRFNRQGSIEWAYFEDTYTGSILLSQVKERA